MAAGSYRRTDDGRKVICGEGSAAGVNDLDAAKEMAHNEALGKLGQTYKTDVHKMVTSAIQAAASKDAAGASAFSSKQLDAATETIATATLKGAQDEATWISSKRTLHALVCVPFDGFKDTVQKLDDKAIEPKIREAVVAHAEIAWGELEVGVKGR